MKPAALLFALALASSLLAAPQPARPAAQRPQSESLPPMSWTCPMHPDILEDKKGTCPICKMDLVPVRLDSVWSCPVHAVIAEREAGKVPHRPPRSDSADGRRVVDLPRAPTTTVDRPRHVPGRLADGKKSTPRAARQSQPAARRPVLHGVRQLASSRRHLPAVGCVQDARLRRLHQAAAGESGSRHHGERRDEGCERKGIDDSARPERALSSGPRRQAAAAGGDVRQGEVQSGRAG